MKQTKDKTAAISNAFNNIIGKKKQGAELVAMKHPETEELIFDPEGIKSASIDYCVHLLKNTCRWTHNLLMNFTLKICYPI